MVFQNKRLVNKSVIDAKKGAHRVVLEHQINKINK